MKTDYVGELLQNHQDTPDPPHELKSRLEAIAIREARRTKRRWWWSVISLTGGALGLLFLSAVSLMNVGARTPVDERMAAALDVGLMHAALNWYQYANTTVWVMTAALWCAVGFAIVWLCGAWPRQSQR